MAESDTPPVTAHFVASFNSTTELLEQVYLDAARADVAAYWAEAGLTDAERAEDTAHRIAARVDFRAGIEHAYWAGYGAGRDDEAAGVG